MNRIIKTETDYKQALSEAENLIDIDPEPGTVDGDKLELLTLLISFYEDQHFPMDMPDPVDAIRFRMEQQDLLQKDLIPYIGNKNKVSEVLSKKRPLSLMMIRKLNQALKIPAEILIQEFNSKHGYLGPHSLI